MKALVMSISAGQGHNQTAKVLCDYLESTGVNAEFLDTFEFINPLLSDSVEKGYLLSTKNMPKLYGSFYSLAEKHNHGDLKTGSISYITTALLAQKLKKYITDKSPDVIVCTHVFAAMLVTYLVKTLNLETKTIGIVTDFTVHPFWESCDLDYYITASEILNYQMTKKDIPTERVKPLGIPIDPKFSKRLTKEEACEKLGIPCKNTVFVMSGSMGYGNLFKVASELNEIPLDFQIITVCGNNKKAYSKIEKAALSKVVLNCGFVDNVDVIMDASDCIITKPGGLTVSEALAKGLPIIMTNPIPGQEDRNVEFLLNNGAAVKISKTYTLGDALFRILGNEERLSALKTNVRFLGKPCATADFAEFVKSI